MEREKGKTKLEALENQTQEVEVERFRSLRAETVWFVWNLTGRSTRWLNLASFFFSFFFFLFPFGARCACTVMRIRNLSFATLQYNSVCPTVYM